MTRTSVRAGALALLACIAIACGSGNTTIPIGAAGHLQRLRRCHLRRIYISDPGLWQPGHERALSHAHSA